LLSAADCAHHWSAGGMGDKVDEVERVDKVRTCGLLND